MDLLLAIIASPDVIRTDSFRRRVTTACLYALAQDANGNTKTVSVILQEQQFTRPLFCHIITIVIPVFVIIITINRHCISYMSETFTALC